jgi:ATP-dependent DNA helicase RecQ
MTKIMIATNAFGMGINIPDVSLVIHFNFPLSLGQYIQESGRAGRNGQQARSITFYSRSELKLLYGIISEKREDRDEEETIERRVYLEQGNKKLHEVMYFCEEKYKCLQQWLLSYYAWSTDTSPISSCGNCGNCQRKEAHNPELVNVTSDAIRMVNVVKEIKEEFDVITYDDIIGVFLQLKNKKLINI